MMQLTIFLFSLLALLTGPVCAALAAGDRETGGPTLVRAAHKNSPDLKIEFGRVSKSSVFASESWSHWGGSVVKGDDGLYHMLYSRWPKNLGWAWVTDCIGVILDALDKSPYADNTIVVLWSDHGWLVGEKLRYKKSTLWEETARMPLLIKVPGLKPGRTKRPVSLIDLYPTLIELAGLPQKEGLSGRSIVPVLKIH